MRYGSEDHLIAKFPKPPKDNEKRRKKLSFNEKGNRACDNIKNNSYQNIYACIARMSSSYECPSGNLGDSLQLTYSNFYYRATCQMTPEVLDFIPGSLEDTDKHIEVVDKHHVIAGKNGQVRIKMCDNHGNPFIATLHNVLLAPDLCDRLFPIIKLMNSGHPFLFH